MADTIDTRLNSYSRSNRVSANFNVNQQRQSQHRSQAQHLHQSHAPPHQHSSQAQHDIGQSHRQPLHQSQHRHYNRSSSQSNNASNSDLHGNLFPGAHAPLPQLSFDNPIRSQGTSEVDHDDNNPSYMSHHFGSNLDFGSTFSPTAPSVGSRTSTSSRRSRLSDRDILIMHKNALNRLVEHE